MLGVIGLGQGGSSVANLFASLDVPTIAINYSEKDLDTCQNIKNKLKLIGSEGVGKNRKLAVELLHDNWETALNTIKQRFSQPSIKLILIIFSTGGGSGSGIAPMISELVINELHDKTVVLVPILPSNNESTVSLINTQNCLSEISQIEAAILPIDNSKKSISNKSTLYKQINTEFVQMIMELVKTTTLESPYSNLDQKDLLTILSTKGFMSIGQTQLNILSHPVKLDVENVTEKIQRSWNESIFADFEMSVLSRIGVVYQGEENWMDLVQPSEIINPFKMKPIDIFEGYYNSKNCTVTTVLTGLKFSQQRLSELQHAIDHALKGFNQQSFVITTASKEVPIRDKNKQKKTLSNILSKYKS